ncbi:uncharacterized protein PV09_05255 [Verruconis gallopava]|uniref:Cyclin N-terminal domain-containing protein n=1 Tax=Verruconis gallopava TaxID=253628 RepID=A0A0D2A9T5_9PEZI|nr:uncharacterized protein PV09_05255 [Verruconis gallopava]KIW03488.1 hypothetical protein PV09_05255 [Verruconis gallopava]
MTELMPHAVASETHLQPWPYSKASHRTLPLPPSTYEQQQQQPVSKQAFLYNNGPPTPPLTSDMNGLAQSAHRGHQLSYPVRTQVPATHAAATAAQESLPQASNAYIKSSTPGISNLAQAEPHGRQSPSHINTISTAFRLPSSIQAPQANLPQLAAETACLFWFESSATIARIEKWTPGSPVLPNALSPTAIPSTMFRKWLSTLLATTQVSPNVIILALLFIYKLKGFNQHLKGGPNSEFKLMTVALMLGNKFLDDNTYTNKTWADVSAIPVKDVHIMEVEFLSNMRYSLFTSDEQWSAWHKKLGRFGTYIDLANKAREAAALRPTLLTPTTAHFPNALPSPPHPYSQLSPQFAATYSPNHLPPATTPVLLPQPGSSAISPIGPLPELDPRFSRKRSYDEGLSEPPAKRQVPAHYHEQMSNVPVTTLSQPQPQALHPPVQVPSLPVQHVSQISQIQPASQLPAPGSRAMSLVYQPPASQHFQPQVTLPTSMAPLQTSALPQLPALHPDHARQLSPFTAGSATSSPVNSVYTPTGQMQQRHSPSYFLAQRSSPYRPVRQVQTLLAPPSSTPLYNAPRLVSQDQMQYHPLGRPFNERRVGHLPYLDHEAWPQHHQYNQWSEVIPPPAPNFHA